MKRFSFLIPRMLLLWAVCGAECLILLVLSLFRNHFLTVLLLLFLLLDSACFFLWIFRPLSKTRAVMRAAALHDCPERIFKQFSGFCAEEQKVMQQIAKEFDRSELIRLEIQESELLALQNQINPHFLYNTLEAIRSDALLSGAQDVADITEALATYFRYTISSLDCMVSLSEELHNIETYFAIQRYRFGNDLQLHISYSNHWDFSETLYLPKMTLQPLVENAILHGLEPCESLGEITVWLDRTPKVLLICVEDNGTGMGEQQVVQLKHSLEGAPAESQTPKRHGIALRNVHHRLQLLFGHEYGLQPMSATGFGTEVWVTLPVCLEAHRYEK